MTYARNNSNQLEIVSDQLFPSFADTEVNPFVKVPTELEPFIDSSYQVVDEVIVPPSLDYLKDQIKSKVASTRFNRETGSIKLPNDAVISTTRESQAQLSAAYSSMKNSLITSTPWKNQDGTWSELTLSELEPIAQAVAEYVSNCFKAEKDHDTAIDALAIADELYIYDINTNWPDNGFTPVEITSTI